MPQFDLSFYPAQIFWLLVSFGFLYLMMRYLICPQIEGILEEREKKVEQTLKEAEKRNQEAADFHQRYQIFLLDAEQEKTDQIQKAYQSIRRKMKVLESKNDNRLHQRIRRAEEKIEMRAEELKHESDKLSVQLAKQLAEKIQKGGVAL